MSAIGEYISLLPKGIKNATKIAEGIVNSVKLKYNALPKEEQEEIIRRRVICKGCPFMSRNAPTSEEYFLLTGEHYKTDRGEEHCSMCGCPITLRTASLDKNCGMEDHNQDHPNNPRPLFWEKFKN